MDKYKDSIIKFLKIFISLSLMAYLLSKNDWLKIIEAIKNINLLWFFCTLIIPCVIIPVMATIRWQIILSPGNIKLKLRDMLKLTYTGLFFNLVLPGSVGGDTIKGVIFYRLTKNSSLSASSIVLDRMIGLLALTILSAIASGVYYKISSDITYILVSGGFLLILLFTFCLMVISPFQKLLLSLIRWTKIKNLEDFTQKSLTFLTWFRKNPKILLLTIGLSIASHILSVIICYLISLSLGLKIFIGYHFLFFPLIALIFSVPVSIAGLGLREGAFAYFYSLIGVPQESSLALSLLYFFQCMLVSLAGGIIYMFSSFPPKEELMEEAKERDLERDLQD